MAAILEHKFFLSEIIGRRVYLKTERVGRLTDMVIVETGKLPEVTHFVVNRPFGYPSLLLPWDKLTLISNTEIVFDVQAPDEYERVPAEGSILLRAHILDKKILDMDDHEVEVIYDIKLDVQGGKLRVSEVDFSRQRLLRRMGLKKLAEWIAKQRNEQTVSWMYVQPLPEHIGIFKGHVKLNVLKENISDIHPVDLADILEELDGDQRLAVFKEIEPEHASDTLEEVEPRVQRELIRSMEKHYATQLINAMSPAQAADILAALPATEADALLQLIDKDSAAKIQKIIDHHDENILLFSSQKFMKMPESTLVSEVMKDFREIARDKDVIMYVYATDDQDVLTGVVALREIIAAEPDQSIGEVMTDNVISLSPEDTLSDAVDMFARYGFRAIPITNEQNNMLAVVSFSDIRGIKPRLD
ncbi:magnesium transporter MgtE [mine drainage metagenome]|uniref:Magnesium transporter MgtE n=1 Tax=mine drainage metagenome TaxID=410659 RepID=A0A1J5SEG2_9ZZZZ